MIAHCEWCDRLIPGEATTCSSSCRGRRHRFLRDIPNAKGEVEAPWAGSPLHVVKAEKKRRRRGGIQVSFNKALASLTSTLAGYVMASGCSALEAREEIEGALADALSPRQRERYEGMRNKQTEEERLAAMGQMKLIDREAA